MSTGIPNLPIELSATHFNKKSNDQYHLFDISSLRDLPEALQKPIAIFRYGDPHKTQNIIVEISKDGKNFLIGLHFNLRQNGILINSIRGLFPKDLHEWLNWIQQGKLLYVDKKKIQNQITQRQINLADVSYLDLDSINNIIADFENPSQNSNKIEKSVKKNERERRETEEDIAKLSLPEYRLADAPEDLKQFVNDLFMRGEHAKTDIRKLSRTFGTIFHYSRKLPSLERMFDRAAEIDEIKHGIANHQLKKPSDLKGGILKERYHIPEGYDKLLQKIENARAFL